MGPLQRLTQELKALTLTTVYFGTWLGILVVLKALILAEYNIKFHGLTVAVVGTLLMAKVVLLMERVPLGSWVRDRPRVVDVLLRTALYGLGVLVMLLVEKAFEGRHESGGLGRALTRVFEHRDMPHVWANTICLSSALLGFNALSVVRRHLGEHALARLFLSPPPAARESRNVR